MKKIGIFYGSSTGSTSDLAQKIAKELNAEANVFDIANCSASDLLAYDVLLLGSSTWGMGDLQSDWETLLPELGKQNLSGKSVGLFGCGDSACYSDTFCNALALIKEGLEGSGCTFIGSYAPKNYNYDESASEQDGELIGLCIDESNESDMTDERIDTWIKAMQPAL
ncbi:flavodoxin [Porphyromonas macacae]|uniref:Flavodoxin n=1 Tax=Porphyromonas macacae TaxID=28115 RepID=A0A0A2E8C7_9PORP|nr:flavodoxin FldA [Porphyromonas macacae]KGN73700.1 flavodoxin [Porphyromonas macacae]